MHNGAAQVIAGNDMLWTAECIASNWHNTPSIATLKSSLDRDLNAAPADRIFILQAVLSPDAGTLISSLAPGTPHSLEDMARSMAPQLPGWVETDWAHRTRNVVIVDWFEQSQFVAACIAANIE